MPTASPEQLAAWMIGAAAVVVFVKNGLAVVDRLKGHPPSGDLKSSIDSLTVRIGALEKIAEHDTTRRREIYTKIEEVRDGVTEQIERVHSRVDELQKEMHEQIKDLPNELVVLLRNTGAIHPK